MIELANGATRLTLRPGIGGGVARLTWRGHDVLRPAALDATDPLDLAAFPLVPYSNRVRGGRFIWDGRRIQLPGAAGHALHGGGWRAAWNASGVTATTARLGWFHPAADWPWDFYASQDCIVQPDGIELVLAITNRGPGPMPAGLGWHPYFVKPPGTTLTAPLDGWWETDAAVLPARHVAAPGTDWTGKLHPAVTTDNVFTGFSGEAVFETPEVRTALVSGEAARWLVIYAPAGADFACIEPVTHPTDALNADGLPGIAVLAVGETLALGIGLGFSAPARSA